MTNRIMREPPFRYHLFLFFLVDAFKVPPYVADDHLMFVSDWVISMPHKIVFGYYLKR